MNINDVCDDIYIYIKTNSTLTLTQWLVTQRRKREKKIFVNKENQG